MNRWGIPDWLEAEVRERDKVCVYCGIQMIQCAQTGQARRSVATWEHIVNDASIVTPDNIARCCAGCNSSKGTMGLADWLQSTYCEGREISRDTVAAVINRALDKSATPRKASDLASACGDRT